MGFDSGLLLQIAFLLVLVGINAFFAASEIAIISLNDNKVRKMADEGHKKARLLEDLISEPSRFLATIQVGITLSGLLASAFAAESFADRLTGWVRSSGLLLNESLVKTVSLVVITLLLSYLTLVFGELVPKRVAMQKPEQISMLAVTPISILSVLTRPFVRLLTFSTNFIIRLFGGNPDADEEQVTEEEILMMVDVGQEKGVIQGTEKEMINNIFNFDDTAISEIMTHRTDIAAVPQDANLEEVLHLMLHEKFTRIPVYEEDIDNIVGILHVKDLLPFVGQEAEKVFDLRKVMRKPYFVPESKKTDELFKEMQKNKTHIAVVVDEYGGTAGIVTMEDLLEEIVGNIFDEYDEEEKELEKLDDNTYLASGTLDLDRLCETLDTELPLDEYDTLSGFITGQLGRIPSPGEKPTVEFNGLLFKVEQVNERRISKVKICKV